MPLGKFGEISSLKEVSAPKEISSLNSESKNLTNQEAKLAENSKQFWENLFPDTIDNFNKEVENIDKPFSNLSEMKSALNLTYDEIKKIKPQNSPNISKWLENNGKISITENDKNTAWTYIDSERKSVSYIDGYPLFPKEAKHPFIGDISIEKFTGDRIEDKKLYLEKLQDEYGLTEIPKGYALHHDSENGNMQLIREDYHKEFTHAGGHSKFKEEVKC